MTTIMPQSELTRKAVAWICELRDNGDERPLSALIEEAGGRFNLSPKDMELIIRFFKENKG
ncbi:hypothetical protein DND132_0431 [Pseudodesulfovibrio mercurii]|uniref:Uncharacterized protein n=1 Tax=Pseudodesulfovibrio mercurii TaxID=641491 RepID=F0JF92_9BACT|nr:hypothetical protein [Pseudodesulfovibrio mercurii]EGB13648.1 hypothetical protein DND132_0431 [Pseudodesulfovibrio mercurii]